MKARRSLSAACLLIGLLASAAPLRPAIAAGAMLETLRAAVDEYPDDPDLLWAFARELAAEGRASEATAQTRRLLARWPERRPDARLEVARRLLERDAIPDALALLEEEIGDRPESGTARFYRALALRRDGRLAEADREFQLAGRFEPELRAETLLARALGLFEMNREQDAVSLLVEVLNLDPTSDTATRARLMLRQREQRPSTSPLRANGYVGFEWNDNVTLESAENETPASDQEDFLGIWGVGLTGRLTPDERTVLSLGYRFDQSQYADLTSFSLLSNTLVAGARWLASERLALQLDGIASNTLQDFENELTLASIRPSVVYSLGPDWGALRIFGKLEVAEYDDPPIFTAWERDSVAASVGLEHFLPLRLERSWLALSGAWQRTLTQARPSGGPDGFDGDYDYDSLRARALADLALPWLEMRGRLEASYSHDQYLNDNLAHLIATGGTRKRRDDVISGRIGLSGEIAGPVRLEVYWRGTRRLSNVDVFKYDKQIVGVLLRVSTD